MIFDGSTSRFCKFLFLTEKKYLYSKIRPPPPNWKENQIKVTNDYKKCLVQYFSLRPISKILTYNKFEIATLGSYRDGLTTYCKLIKYQFNLLIVFSRIYIYFLRDILSEQA